MVGFFYQIVGVQESKHTW